MRSDWQPRVDAVVAEGRASAQGVLHEVQEQLEHSLAEMSEMLAGQAKAVRDVSGLLGGGTERLVSAGQALVAYLAERDRALEAERDRILHEVLEEFAIGLSPKERKAVASRVGEALDRRRDVRDAHRYRRSQQGQPAVEVPPVTPEIAELVEPIQPVQSPLRRPRATAAPRPTRATPTSNRRSGSGTTARKTAKSTTKSAAGSGARKATRSAGTRTASTRKNPSKTTKKAASTATAPADDAES
jgi:hypothetical protein